MSNISAIRQQEKYLKNDRKSSKFKENEKLKESRNPVNSGKLNTNKATVKHMSYLKTSNKEKNIKSNWSNVTQSIKENKVLLRNSASQSTMERYI